MSLWGGRFQKATDPGVRTLNDSIGFDWRLYDADITGSVAYARAIEGVGLLTPEERDALVAGLEEVRREFASGSFELSPGDEDIHTAVERRLGEIVGSAAGKLHTGRSRNDQVATDLRLYVLEQAARLYRALLRVQEAVLAKAEAHLDVIMPGYTHLQQAQPVLFSHWMMSFFWKLQRDAERLRDLCARAASLPLGAGAVAGNPFAVDREALAQELGFARVAENSMDAVSDRDYVVEFLSWAALVQVHLSGLAEDLIIWASREFGFVAMDDAFSTGSSLMPQKKNPDVLELFRGKSGRMTGHLVQMLTTLKGLPSSYDKDLQEDKEGLFDAIDTVALELPIAADLLASMTVRTGRMQSALDDAMLSTDLADYLVRQGVPFRTTHHLVGQAVQRAEALGVTLRGLPLSEYQSIYAGFDQGLYDALDFEHAVAARAARGGTAPAAVREQIERARVVLSENKIQIMGGKCNE